MRHKVDRERSGVVKKSKEQEAKRRHNLKIEQGCRLLLLGGQNLCVELLDIFELTRLLQYCWTDWQSWNTADTTRPESLSMTEKKSGWKKR